VTFWEESWQQFSHLEESQKFQPVQTLSKSLDAHRLVDFWKSITNNQEWRVWKDRDAWPRNDYRIEMIGHSMMTATPGRNLKNY